jgi:AcrR family transcriptional regulator
MEPCMTSDAELASADITDSIDRPPAADRLLAAAIAAIDAGGENNVKVQDIADAAGVQIPILYRKFGSRDGLIQAAHIARLSTQLERDAADLRAAMDSVRTVEEFTALVEVMIVALCSPARAEARMKRINILGSAYGRPALAKAIADAQRHAIANIASAFRHAQQQGWLRPGLDLEALAAWVAGVTLGRVVIEVGDSGVDDEAWDAIYADALRHVLLG